MIDLKYRPKSYWDKRPPDGEFIKIAEVYLASGLGDFISVWATPENGLILYQITGMPDELVEDEDEFEWELELEDEIEWDDRSRIPLTLKRLISLIGTTFIVNSWESTYEFERNIDDAEQFVSISSDFYLELETYYAEQFEEWKQDKLDYEGYDSTPIPNPLANIKEAYPGSFAGALSGNQGARAAAYADRLKLQGGTVGPTYEDILNIGLSDTQNQSTQSTSPEDNNED